MLSTRTGFWNAISVFFLVSTSLIAQEPTLVRFGNTSYARERGGAASALARTPLTISNLTRGDVMAPANLRRVGGISFYETAKPPKDLEIKRFTFSMDDTQGKYFAVINGKRYLIPLFDWEIIPIVKYVNSNDRAIFTLFGGNVLAPDSKLLFKKLAAVAAGEVRYDSELREQVRRQREVQKLTKSGDESFFVMLYHEAFRDSLMGLRLMQFDSLGAHGGLRMYPELPKYSGPDGDYVLGEGEPEILDVNSNIKNAELLSKTLNEISDAGGEYNAYVITDDPRQSEPQFSLKGNQITMTTRPYFSLWRNGEGLGPDGQKEIIVFEQDQRLKIFNEQLSDSPFLAKANPVVYNAVTKVLRYGSFFRYVKNEYPEAWQTLVDLTTQREKSQNKVIRIQTPDLALNPNKSEPITSRKSEDYLSKMQKILGMIEKILETNKNPQTQEVLSVDERRDLDERRRAITDILEIVGKIGPKPSCRGLGVSECLAIDHCTWVQSKHTESYCRSKPGHQYRGN